jgi:hypothetical protein
MAELIAIRTFMKLKALDSIPKTGSISLADLLKATGAQESILGKEPLFSPQNASILTSSPSQNAWHECSVRNNPLTYPPSKAPDSSP